MNIRGDSDKEEIFDSLDSNFDIRIEQSAVEYSQLRCRDACDVKCDYASFPISDQFILGSILIQ